MNTLYKSSAVHLMCMIPILFFSVSCADKKTVDAPEVGEKRAPNIVVIFMDDMGYGDITPYGNPTAQTPIFERLAYEGQKWTNFYAAFPTCTRSRAALLTGRLPIRIKRGDGKERLKLVFPDHVHGMHGDEITIAEMLKESGYATAAVGKWHLGHMPDYLPTAQGFDSYFGIPYSNDMDAVGGPTPSWVTKPLRKKLDLMRVGANINDWDVVLMEDEEVIERPVDQWTITQRYTDKAVEFISDNKDRPFFLYLAHSLPHIPLFTAKEFWGKSVGGYYADVINELDHSTGQVIDALERNGLGENTLVVVTSDNGPWIGMMDLGGSPGPLRGGKGTTWEGGMRVPAIFWWPGKISPRVEAGIGSTLDLLPTIAALTGSQVPPDRVIDGVDQSKTLTGNVLSARDSMIFYKHHRPFAIRKGSLKLHVETSRSFGIPADGSDRIYGKEVREMLLDQNKPQVADPALLFNVDLDPGERYDIAHLNPEEVQSLKTLLEEHLSTIEPLE